MENAALRSRILHKIGSQLSEIANRFKIAVGFTFYSPTIVNLFFLIDSFNRLSLRIK